MKKAEKESRHSKANKIKSGHVREEVIEYPIDHYQRKIFQEIRQFLVHLRR